MLNKKYLRRKLTGECDVFTMEPIDPVKFSGKIPGSYCHQPARFYSPAEVGLFGMYLCDTHAEEKVDNE